MKLFCDLKKSKRVSKNGTNYEVTIITIKCDCGVSMIIEDFKVNIPFDVSDMEITIIKDTNNRYVIPQLNYTIGWAYSMGVSLLLAHKH